MLTLRTSLVRLSTIGGSIAPMQLLTSTETGRGAGVVSPLGSSMFDRGGAPLPRSGQAHARPFVELAGARPPSSPNIARRRSRGASSSRSTARPALHERRSPCWRCSRILPASHEAFLHDGALADSATRKNRPDETSHRIQMLSNLALHPAACLLRARRCRALAATTAAAECRVSQATAASLDDDDTTREILSTTIHRN